MEMKEAGRGERGQVLVIMVFAMIGLLVFAGLAIDGGTVFLERRRMQNAADAAALAGARKLAEVACQETVTAAQADAAILAAVTEYANRNGASHFEAAYTKYQGNQVVEFSPRVLVGNGTVPIGAAGVAVTPTMTRPTYFMGLIGIPTSAASAYALAVTGPPLMAGGLRPFGVPEPMMRDMPPGTVFKVDFDNNGGTIRWVSGVAQHRGWMNLAYMWKQDEEPTWPRAVDQSAGASDLKRWMENGWDGPQMYADCLWSAGCRFGDYVHAKPGSDASAVCAAPKNTIFTIPIYDEVPDCPTQIPAPKAPCPTQGGSYCYHIVGFASIVIKDCSQGKKEITAELISSIIGQGHPSPNAGYGAGLCGLSNVLAVTLWR